MKIKSRKGIKVPAHVGIIPDGNRRWVKSKKTRINNFKWYLKHKDNLLKAAYERGAERLKETLLYMYDLGVEHITFYAFSAENFKRSEAEKFKFMSVMKEYLGILHTVAKEKKIHVNFVGDTKKFPETIQTLMKEIAISTDDFKGKYLNMLAGYDSKENRGEFEDTPYIDLVIRTSGEERLSGFAPELSKNAELYFPKVFWPDFDKGQVYKAFKEYTKRERRLGV